MVSHSPSTVPGLKILVSAVRFCPWPHFPFLEISQLQALRSRLSSINGAHFEVTLKFPFAAGPRRGIDRASRRLLSWTFHQRWRSVDKSIRFCGRPFSWRRYGKHRHVLGCGRRFCENHEESGCPFSSALVRSSCCAIIPRNRAVNGKLRPSLFLVSPGSRRNQPRPFTSA